VSLTLLSDDSVVLLTLHSRLSKLQEIQIIFGRYEQNPTVGELHCPNSAVSLSNFNWDISAKSKFYAKTFSGWETAV
jgi:hypothetical protein